MQARYYDPVIGRFYSNDPIEAIGHLNSLQGVQGFNRYAYVNNNPYKYTDPTGMYGRGAGWSDDDWEKFDAAQQQAASDMSSSSYQLREIAGGLADGATTGDGYSASELVSMADSLDAGAAALNDDGSGGFTANAVSTSDLNGNFGSGEIGGKNISVATDHAAFGNNQETQWMAGHESLHNAGLKHPAYMSFVPYRFGSFGQRQSFKKLPANRRAQNPDHVISTVYP